MGEGMVMPVITDEMIEDAAMAIAEAEGRGELVSLSLEYSLECMDKARAALTAALPLIRDMVLDEVIECISTCPSSPNSKDEYCYGRNDAITAVRDMKEKQS